MTQRNKKNNIPPPPEGTQPIPAPKDFEGTGVRLKDGQYWKWRLTIEEMQHASTTQSLRSLECKYQELQIQNDTLKLSALRSKLQEQVSAVSASKIEYDQVKKEIETDLGISLSNCLIDEHTWEIKRLPSQQPSPN